MANVVITFVIFAVYILVARPGNSGVDTLGAVPWWAYLGGVCGAVYLFCLTALAPRLGGATLFGLIVLGQLTVVATRDHLGALGLPQHSLSAGRIVGLLLLIAEVVFVRRF